MEFTDSLIYDKAISRIIYTLETLDNGQNLVSSKYLADQLHCSVRTISNDINQLKSDIPKDWKIISVKTKGYILIKPITDCIFPIINFYLTESVIYKIMLGIFYNKYYSLEKWSQILYMNKLTLKHNLEKHRNLIKNSKLDINFRELNLIGDEINIRHYYSAFFYNTQKYTNEILLPIQLREKISSILIQNKVDIDFEMLCSILFVFINRIFHKHYITQKYNVYPLFDRSQTYCFSEIISTIENFYKVKLPDIEKDGLYNYLFIASNITDVQNELVIAYLRGVKPEDYNNYIELIDILLVNNNIQDDKKEKLILILSTAYYKRLIQEQYKLSMSFLFDPLNKIQSTLLKDYSKNELLISSWNKGFNNEKFTYNEIRYFATYATIVINSMVEKVDILFLFCGSEPEKRIVYSILNESLGNNVRLHENEANDIEYDYIITNYRLSNRKIPMIYLSERLTEYDINSIKNRIFKLN